MQMGDNICPHRGAQNIRIIFLLDAYIVSEKWNNSAINNFLLKLWTSSNLRAWLQTARNHEIHKDIDLGY